MGQKKTQKREGSKIRRFSQTPAVKALWDDSPSSLFLSPALLDTGSEGCSRHQEKRVELTEHFLGNHRSNRQPVCPPTANYRNTDTAQTHTACKRALKTAPSALHCQDTRGWLYSVPVRARTSVNVIHWEHCRGFCVTALKTWHHLTASLTTYSTVH